MIPDEAVEAALETFLGDNDLHTMVRSALEAAAPYMHRVITTEEELDALPVGSVVLDSGRDVCERMSFGWFGIVKEEGADPWLLSGAEDIPLPATVLHLGDAA